MSYKVQYALCCACLFSFFTSCSPEIYNANSLNVPLLAQKGNAKIALSSTFAREKGGGFLNNNLQGAYALSDHLGIMVNGMYHNYTRTYTPLFSTTQTTNRHKEGFIEAGLGYYGHVGNNSKWRGEIYGGFGLGKSKETNPNNQDALTLESPYNRLFLQPSFGFVSKYFDAALSVRGSYLSVGQVNWVGNTLHGKTLKGTMWEPCLTIRAGKDRIKPFIQYAWLLHDDKLTPVVSFEGFLTRLFTLQLGISLNLREVYPN